MENQREYLEPRHVAALMTGLSERLTLARADLREAIYSGKVGLTPKELEVLETDYGNRDIGPLGSLSRENIQSIVSARRTGEKKITKYLLQKGF